MKVVIDTNLLIYMVQAKIDIFSRIAEVVGNPEFYVLDKTIQELEKLINSNIFSQKNAAKVALQIIKRKSLKVLKTAEKLYADDALVALDPEEYVVATEDKELKNRLKAKQFKVLTLRQKKYIVME